MNTPRKKEDFNIILISVPLMDDENEHEPQLTAMDQLKTFPPYAIYLLAAVLLKDGYNTKIIDLSALGSLDLLKFNSLLSSAHLVGISSTSLSWPSAVRCIKTIKCIRPDLPIVLGGIHATLFDTYLIHTFNVSFVIRGEGERALLALCEALFGFKSFSQVPNLTYISQQGKIIRNPAGNPLSSIEIANLPIPLYDLLPNKIYHGISLESSRGCAFDCSFCSTSYRKSWRYIEASTFVDRIELLLPFLEKTRSRYIHIVDDEFSTNPFRCVEICDEFNRRNIHLKLTFDSRANDLLNENYIESIKPYTYQLLIGAECGYNEGLNRIGKKTSCEILKIVASKLAKHGLATRCDFSFIIGLPWEDKTDVLRTIDFGCEIFAKFGVRVLFQWYCQIPGSRLWHEAFLKQQVNESLYNDFGFFRNIYLFRTGVKLTPSEIIDISSRLSAAMKLARLAYPFRNMIEYRHPLPIEKFFPENIVLKSENNGLSNLRELSILARNTSRNNQKKRGAEKLINS